MSRILNVIKISGLPLVAALFLVSCQPTTEKKPTPQAAEQQAAGNSEETVSVGTAIAQTVEAQTALDRIVQQTVEAEIAAQEAKIDLAKDPTQTSEPTQIPDPTQEPVEPTKDPDAPDIVDPDSGIEAIKPADDANVASGTPQLRVIYDSINVRIGPGTNCRPISALLHDSVVPVKSVNQDGKWFEITLPNGQDGWVADSVTDPVVAADMASVPVNNTPYCAPPPTATATSTSVPTSTTTPTSSPTATNTTTAPVNTHTPTSTTAAPANTRTPTSTATTTADTPTPTATATATEPAAIISSNVEVSNNTATEIWYLFIDLSSNGTQTDRLGNNILMPGDTFVVNNLPAGVYNFVALDEFNQIVGDRYNVSVSGYQQWDIR